ncbi:exoribonuclease R [Escherichia coli]|uniref:Exoribonuclease R n=1 Tax=Escherichia coli TaxID=562 RepID=A0A376U1C5_ECOLX|nr:exoribonuclease R [Escherichia coli]
MEVRVEAVNMDERKIDFSLISSERAPRNVGKRRARKRKKGDAGKKGGKRRQVGKKVNFEPDSAFRGEKKNEAESGEERREKSEKAIGENAENSRSDQSEACGEEKSGRVINTLFKRRG